ncbi:hypothetical protein TREPR_0752 [Treponema primitia ZAS-2]|uniref:Uncharacterized protein n=1 Tax=Treponema primitia (strain ATCC BAA-887 / DSM 12427 / ZAS-2) TaxID=545694 RepID=F5YJD7_TREPZ|nr:hypothetical protein [Treponema primitia]AEF85162.1 hypothetical protein TREPR_0752 [Treponema primitia ZAS-2]
MSGPCLPVSGLRPTHSFTMAGSQRGKWLSASCQWQSGASEQGAPSPIESTIIP